MSTRAGSASSQLRDAAAELEAADAELAAADAEYRAQLEQSDRGATGTHATARCARSTSVPSTSKPCRNASQLANQLTLLESQLVSARSDREKCRARLDELARAARRAGRQARCSTSDRKPRLKSQFDACQAELRAGRRAARRAAARTGPRRQAAPPARSQLTRTRERIAVLSELEQRLEGLDGGVQEVLARPRRAIRTAPSATSAAWWPICSMSMSIRRRWWKSRSASGRSSSSSRRRADCFDWLERAAARRRRPRRLSAARQPPRRVDGARSRRSFGASRA